MKLNFLSGGWAAIVPLSAAIGAYLYFVFLPGMHEIQALKTDMAAKEQAVLEAQNYPAKVKEVDIEAIAARAYLDKWRGLAAKPEEFAKLFADLSQLLKKSGATTTIFRPEARQQWTEFERVPLTIGCRGTFAQVQTLIASIEGVPQRIWIEEATMHRNNQNGKLVDCELKLAIFADNFEISN